MTKIQRQAAFLGALLLVVGFGTGGLLAMAMGGQISADAHLVRAAHLNAFIGCFWLCAVACTLHFTRFGEQGARRLVLLTAVPAYAAWALTILSAFLHVSGLAPNGDARNDALFVAFNLFVVVPSLASSIAWVYGLAKERVTTA